MNKQKCIAILLAAGSGSRMKSSVAKQFMLLDGKPLIWYALRTIEHSDIIDECILVTREADREYVQRDIVDQYEFRKVKKVVAGGAERYLSVDNALRAIEENSAGEEGYVFIHDGARPFLTEAILERTYEAVQQYHACVAAMPAKDTVKIADRDGFAVQTPDRNLVWNVQTPQAFDLALFRKAYARLREEMPHLKEQGITITDDAGVVELFASQKVKMVQGSYDNIKITTPDDLDVAQSILRNGDVV